MTQFTFQLKFKTNGRENVGDMIDYIRSAIITENKLRDHPDAGDYIVDDDSIEIKHIPGSD